VRLEALEVAFDVICTGSGAAELSRAVVDAWDSCLVEPDARAEAPEVLTLVLDDDHDRLAALAGESQLFGSDLPTVMDRLSPMITRIAVTTRREDLVMVHACAVGDPETGAAAVLFGPSGTGKTTLARALCTDLAYLSDETAGIREDDLGIVPYPKPLSIIVTPGDVVKEQVAPARLGLRDGDGTTYRLQALVQLCREPDHDGDVVLEHLPIVDALPELVSQTSYTRQMERPLHRLAALADRVGGVHRVTYAEAVQLRPVVRALLDGDRG
jgi:ATPase family protein associated with various cellular activities (AAA)